MRLFLTCLAGLLCLGACQSSSEGEQPPNVTVSQDTARVSYSLIVEEGLDGKWTRRIDSTKMKNAHQWLIERGFSLDDRELRKFEDRVILSLLEHNRQDSLGKSYYELAEEAIYVKADTSQ